MTVSIVGLREVYNGDGVSVTFPFPYYFLQNTDLDVYVGGVLQTLTTNYSASGAGNLAGGSVTFVLPPGVGVGNVVIIRDPDQLQQTSYPSNNSFPSKAQETALDKLTMLVQRIRDLLGRTVALPDSDTSGASTVSPPPLAGALIGWNALGTGLMNYLSSGSLIGIPVSTTQGGTGGVYATFAALCAAISTALGLGTAATKNTGVAAGNIPVLDGSARLPAVDGSQLTNILQPPIVRQTALFGSRDANGLANYLSAGAALNFNVAATATALRLAFAGGFGAGGDIDLVSTISADAANQGALAAWSTNYINTTYASSTSVAWGATLAPPQVGNVYNQAAQSVLQFAGAAGVTTFLDDFGATWSAVGGAKVQTNQFKFGTGALGGGGTSNAMTGGTDYVKSTNFTSLGQGGWSLRGWMQPTALPGAAAFSMLAGALTSGGFGAFVGIWNNAGTIKFSYGLSSAGASFDIQAITAGTTTPVINNWYFVELTFDALAGVYRLYVNGAQEQSTTSATKVCQFQDLRIGHGNTFANGGTFYIDKPEFLPYCQHPNGTSYAGSLPAAAPSVIAAGYASDWFDIGAMQMKRITAASSAAGVNPTLGAVNVLYNGEQDTNATVVTATRNYAYQGRFDNTLNPTLGTTSTSYTTNHNIGVPPELIQLTQLAKASTVVTPNWMENSQAYNGSIYFPSSYNLNRNSANVTTGSSGMSVGATFFATPLLAIRARRAF